MVMVVMSGAKSEIRASAIATPRLRIGKDAPARGFPLGPIVIRRWGAARGGCPMGAAPREECHNPPHGGFPRPALRPLSPGEPAGGAVLRGVRGAARRALRGLRRRI